VTEEFYDVIENKTQSITETLNPKVSVIILNYNGEPFIKRCVSTVLADEYEPKEVIIVDNTSDDNSMTIADSFKPEVKTIRNDKNYGFPKGCNIGIKASDGEIVVLLNVDTAVRKNWLQELVEPFIFDDTVGISGSKLFFLDGKHLQFAGGGMAPNCLTFHEGYGEEDKPEYSEPKEVGYLTGASIAIRRDFLEYINGLDEGFPLYYDDIDLCFTARRFGLKTIYRPKSVVLHFETYGTPKNSFMYYYKYHRGRIRFMLKQFGLRYFLFTFLPAEFRWYRQYQVWKQFPPLLKAYISQFPKAPWFWARGFIVRRWKSQLPQKENTDS